MPTAPATSYDRVPYKSHPFRQSHPDRLAVIATLHGMMPRPIEQARVLRSGEVRRKQRRKGSAEKKGVRLNFAAYRWSAHGEYL